MPDYVTYERIIELDFVVMDIQDFRNDEDEDEPEEDLLVRMARDGYLNAVNMSFTMATIIL